VPRRYALDRNAVRSIEVLLDQRAVSDVAVAQNASYRNIGVNEDSARTERKPRRRAVTPSSRRIGR
jgi:hypothetical protein